MLVLLPNKAIDEESSHVQKAVRNVRLVCEELLSRNVERVREINQS